MLLPCKPFVIDDSDPGSGLLDFRGDGSGVPTPLDFQARNFVRPQPEEIKGRGTAKIADCPDIIHRDSPMWIIFGEEASSLQLLLIDIFDPLANYALRGVNSRGNADRNQQKPGRDGKPADKAYHLRTRRGARMLRQQFGGKKCTRKQAQLDEICIIAAGHTHCRKLTVDQSQENDHERQLNAWRTDRLLEESAAESEFGAGK